MALHRWLGRLLPALLLAWSSLALAAPSADEHATITTLIQRVEQMTTLSFMRNGTAHNSVEAAQHMQAKYAYFKEKITSAEDFIDLCASRSEMTGKPYKVKIGDAAPRDAGDFLREELRAVRRPGRP